MSDHHNPHHEDPKELQHAISLGYDHRDLPTTEVGKVVVILYLFFFVSIGITIGYWRFVDSMGHGMNTPDRQKLAPRQSLPPAPLLQSNVTAKKDMEKLRQEELQVVEKYGYVDKNAGVVRIPIEKAMERLVQQGLDGGTAAR